MYTTTKGKRQLSLLGTSVIFMLIIVMVFTPHKVYAIDEVFTINFSSNNKDSKIEQTIEELNVISNNLVTEIEKQEEERRQKELEEQRILEEQRRKTIESERTVQYYDINGYTDLSVMNTVTADEMNEIINYWSSINGASAFEGQGQVFIDAAKESGLDPIYILAHAAVESGWGHSWLAETHHNYFGIGAFDSNPGYATNYGNSGLAAGIIGGAVWIKNNFYDVGQTSLYTMRYSSSGKHNYCSSTTWIDQISSIMYTSYSLI